MNNNRIYLGDEEEIIEPSPMDMIEESSGDLMPEEVFTFLMGQGVMRVC